MRIYVASFFDTRERLYPVVEELMRVGHTIVSTWLWEDSSKTYENASNDYLLECALRDYSEINQAEVFVIDTIDVNPRGGREVELGVAIAREKYIVRVGPARNVYHQMVTKQFNGWEEGKKFLKSLVRGEKEEK